MSDPEGSHPVSRFAVSLVRGIGFCALLLTASFESVAEGSGDFARKDYAPVVAVLGPFIEQQMSDKGLPALSIALVDDHDTVWAQGFGMADPAHHTAATAATIYRIGSVSKLFTDIAIMQRVERGELELDAPIGRYLPEFNSRNPSVAALTLRELMSHRSGLLREPPVGNYFDPSQPSLANTIASLGDTALVYPPNTHTKYSNAAIALVGYLLESRSGKPFADYLQTSVLDPIGLTHSSFKPEPAILDPVAQGQMWSYDGTQFPAPTFQLGMAPAGSMYSTVEDLATFIKVLLARGRTATGVLLEPATLDQMWSPQFSGGRRIFGLGFILGSLDGHRLIGHGGAIYGFATSLDVLPEDKLGVVVITSKDVANAVTERIAQEALRLALAQRLRKPLTAPPPTLPVPVDMGRRLAGRYGSGSTAWDLTYLSGHLMMLKSSGGDEQELRLSGNSLITDGPVGHGTRVVPLTEAVRIDSTVLPRVSLGRPVDISTSMRGLIGEYGWDHDVLYVFEKDGRLNVLIEWTEFDSLAQISPDVFRFPADSLYDGESAVFTRDADGNAFQVKVSGVTFKRRAIGGVSGGIFRVPPVKNLDDLRQQALNAVPPKETGDFRSTDLVELNARDASIKLDIRYATKNNFLGEPIYTQARAFMQRPAAEALQRAHEKLKRMGYGLLIHDAYRPWYVTKIFWDATAPEQHKFVADPGEGSRHNRGCAVDLTLYELSTGKPVEMTGVYDEMSERSFAGYPGGTSLQRWHRELLRRVMEEEGFLVYPFEWWHFDYQDWQHYALANVPFEKLAAPP